MYQLNHLIISDGLVNKRLLLLSPLESHFSPLSDSLAKVSSWRGVKEIVLSLHYCFAKFVMLVRDKDSMSQWDPGTHTPSSSKWDQLIVLSSVVNFRVQESLWLENRRVIPHIWVSSNCPSVDEDLCIFGYKVAHENGVVYCSSWDQKWYWWMHSKCFFDDCLDVWKVFNVALFDLPIWPNHLIELDFGLSHGLWVQ
ncbi:hypothetical protein G4B88_000220 [Cannabis sativa]|uniref:Uncharacterized protein n=1 Tax=Cannabis sativa TaxID=3483 RepID=A0A7J6GPH8_CANSA|nr:hypothetical protein G4B88_000220 [Cannabis sativa]